MKSKPSPLPSKDKEKIEAQLAAARTAVRHVEENGQTGTYYHELVARLEAALKSEDIDNATQIK